MNIKSGLLQAAAKIAFLGNGQLWADTKAFCLAAFSDEGLTNGERKEKVKKQLSLIFKDAASMTLNFVIEFAVILLVAKYPQFATIIANSKTK